MAMFQTSMCAWLILTAATSAITAATGGVTTGRETFVIVAVAVVSLTGMGVSVWLYRRYERRRHAEFMRRLDEPMPPSRMTVWHPPTRQP